MLGVYLFRGSDVKPGLFIISYVKNRKGNLSDKPWKRQLIKQQMSLPALTVSVIQFPLPALALVMQNQVRVQDLPTKNKRTLESHRKSHKVVKCLKCSQYIKSSTFQFTRNNVHHQFMPLLCRFIKRITFFDPSSSELGTAGGCLKLQRIFRTTSNLNTRRASNVTTVICFSYHLPQESSHSEGHCRSQEEEEH